MDWQKECGKVFSLCEEEFCIHKGNNYSLLFKWVFVVSLDKVLSNPVLFGNVALNIA